MWKWINTWINQLELELNESIVMFVLSYANDHKSKITVFPKVMKVLGMGILL